MSDVSGPEGGHPVIWASVAHSFGCNHCNTTLSFDHFQPELDNLMQAITKQISLGNIPVISQKSWEAFTSGLSTPQWNATGLIQT